jgi:hypothetical protein
VCEPRAQSTTHPTLNDAVRHKNLATKGNRNPSYDSGVGASVRVSIFYGDTTSVQTNGSATFGTSTVDLTQGHSDQNGNGEFVVARSDGKVVNGSYMFRFANNFNGETVCTVNGSAIAS